MKVKINLTQILDLIEHKFFDELQVEKIVKGFSEGKNISFPYVTKKQLKIFRKMGCVKI